MKVLVTGCHGFLGHHVARKLVAAGHEVVGFDRLAGARSPKGERVIAIGEGIRFIEADLSAFAPMAAAVRNEAPDAVIHLAGQFPLRHTAENTERTIASNVSGFLSVMEACLAAKVGRVLYASSVSVSPTRRPSGLYGATKGFGEEAAHVYGLRGLPLVGLRLARIYGPMQRMDTPIYQAARQMLAGGQVSWAGDFSIKRALVYVEDAAEAALRLLTAPLPQQHNVYLVAAEDPAASTGDILTAVAAELGVKARMPEGYRPTPRGGRPNVADLRDVLGWAPATTLEQGAGSLAAWLKEAILR